MLPMFGRLNPLNPHHEPPIPGIHDGTVILKLILLILLIMLLTVPITALNADIIALIGLLASPVSPWNTPTKICLMPSHACLQFPVKTPLTNFIKPLKIFLIPCILAFTLERNIFRTFPKKPNLFDQSVWNTDASQFLNSLNFVLIAFHFSFMLVTNADIAFEQFVFNVLNAFTAPSLRPRVLSTTQFLSFVAHLQMVSQFL